MRVWCVLALVGVFAVQLALTLAVLPPSRVIEGEPIADRDYALHFSRVAAAEQFITQHHRIWGYNPYFLAGYPAGTVFDVNNHFLEVAAFGLSRAGASLPTAFNSIVFVAVLLPPLMIWLAARNFGLEPWASVVAAALSIFLWFTDPRVAGAWRIGVIASGMAMYSLPFAFSLLYRYLDERRWSWYAGFVVTGTVLSLVHPLSFLLFFGSVGVWLLVRARSIDRVAWLALSGFAAVVLLSNLFWIVPLVPHLHLKTASGFHWIGNLTALARDLLGTNESGLRIVIFILAAGGLMTWWDESRRERVAGLAVPASALFVLGYAAGEAPVLRDLETFRCILMASFVLLLPAAAFIVRGPRLLASLSRSRRWMVLALLASVAVHVAGANLMVWRPYLAGNLGAYRLRPLGRDELAVVDWLRSNVGGEQRVMVEHWPLGALVPWYTGHQVIGGPYPLIWMPHNYANFFNAEETGTGNGVRMLGRNLLETTEGELTSALSTYNVGWIVVHSPEAREFLSRASTMEQLARLGRYEVYRNGSDTGGWFVRGAGVVEPGHGSLRLRKASEGEIILKYHWSASLVSDPPQDLLPYELGDDPVPFIRIPDNVHPEFLIHNR